MAIVSPLPEDIEAHARILLEEAEHVSHVQTTMDGPHGLAFIVPDDLAERFLARIHGKAADQEVTDEEVTTEDVPEDAPAPKRRGRQPGRKNKPKTTERAD